MGTLQWEGLNPDILSAPLCLGETDKTITGTWLKKNGITVARYTRHTHTTSVYVSFRDGLHVKSRVVQLLSIPSPPPARHVWPCVFNIQRTLMINLNLWTAQVCLNKLLWFMLIETPHGLCRISTCIQVACEVSLPSRFFFLYLQLSLLRTERKEKLCFLDDF